MNRFEITLGAIAVTALTACTATPEMVEAQKGKCAQIGYTPGTDQYLACVERGVHLGESGQTAVAAGVATSATSMVIADLLF